MVEKLAVQESNVSGDADCQFNKVMLVGTPDWIKSAIGRLHSLGFADAGA